MVLTEFFIIVVISVAFVIVGFIADTFSKSKYSLHSDGYSYRNKSYDDYIVPIYTSAQTESKLIVNRKRNKRKQYIPRYIRQLKN